MLVFVFLFILVSLLGARSAVLVIGKGKIGISCTQRLLSQGIPCKVLVRSIANISPEVAQSLAGAQLIEGDVTDAEGLDRILGQGDIESIIDVHGVSPPRFVKITDLFRSPRQTDASHPYVVNYLGVKNLLASMQKHHIPKLVRITGALVTVSCYNKFVALFNFLLSFSNKYHELSEQAIRESGIDYTVIRPSGLSNMPSALTQTLPPIGVQSKPHYLIAVPGDRQAKDAKDNKQSSIPVPSSISKDDIAALCVDCATTTLYLPKSTIVTCALQGTMNDGNNKNKYVRGSTFSEMLHSQEVRAQFRDTETIVVQPHEKAVLQYAVILTTFLCVLGKGLRIMAGRILPLVWKKMMPMLVRTA